QAGRGRRNKASSQLAAQTGSPAAQGGRGPATPTSRAALAGLDVRRRRGYLPAVDCPAPSLSPHFSVPRGPIMEVMRRVALFLGLSLCGLPALGQDATPREPEVKVRDIAFTGNTFVSGPVLRVLLTTKRCGLFVQSQLDADTEGLRTYYRSFGF